MLPIYKDKGEYKHKYKDKVLAYIVYTPRATNVFGMNSAFLLQFLFPFSVLGFPNSIQTLLLHLFSPDSIRFCTGNKGEGMLGYYTNIQASIFNQRKKRKQVLFSILLNLTFS